MEFLRLLESLRTPFLDGAFNLITRLGEETVGVAVLCVVFWCINKRIAYVIGVAYFLSGLTVQGMKICFRIDRPWVVDTNLKPVPSALANATGYSFPSGHTQSATALFGSLGTKIKNKPGRALCFLLVALVAFSRLYLGVHTPLDVVASLLISFLFVLLTVKLFDDDPISKKRILVLAVFMALYTAATAALASALYLNGTINQSYISDSFKAVGAGAGFAAGMYVERVYINFSVKTKNILLQFVKLVLGFAGVLLIKEGSALITGTGLVVDTVRYFLIIIWVTVLFPLVIKRFFASRGESGAKS